MLCNSGDKTRLSLLETPIPQLLEKLCLMSCGTLIPYIHIRKSLSLKKGASHKTCIISRIVVDEEDGLWETESPFRRLVWKSVDIFSVV